MRKISIFVLLLAILSAAACSVKEDRSSCPGWLCVQLSARSLSLAGGLPTRVSVSHGGVTDTLSLTEDVPMEWLKVEKGYVEISALLGNGASDPSAWGGECDSLWAFNAAFPIDSDEQTVPVTLHKRFATIWFSFDDVLDPELSHLVVRSPEDFRCVLDASDGEASVRLPARSGEAPLELCCLSDDWSGQLWWWDLGAALLAAGYDWGAKDLSDARVRVSLAPLDISVTVVPWDGNGGLILEI